MFDHEKLTARTAAGDFTINVGGKPLRAVPSTDGGGRIGALSWKVNNERVGNATLFSLTVTNTGDKPLDIGGLVLFSHAEDGVSGNVSSRIIYDFRNSLCDNFVVPVTAFSGSFDTCPMFLVTDGSRTLLAAQMTFRFNEIHFRSQFSPDGALALMECVIDNPSFPLAGGMSFTTDKVAIYDYDEMDPLDALFAWASDVRAINHPELPAETFGGMTTGTLNADSEFDDEARIDAQLKNIGILPQIGVKYFWISIDNLKGGRPGNWLYPDEVKFPNSLRKALDKIRAAGLEPGFWINPFAITSDSDDFEKMKPFLIRKNDGTPASRGTWVHTAPDANGNLPELFALDPACPEVYDYIENVFRTYASWGVRYYMIDYLAQGRYAEGEISSGYGLENYLRLLNSLKKFAAPGTHFLSATGSSVVHIGAISSSRIGMDYCEGRPLHKHWPSYPATYVIGGSLGSAGAPNRNAVNNMAMWAFADKAFFRCNSNMMTVDKPVPLNEARMTASLYGISSSPVFFGDMFNEIDAERLELVKKILPRGDSMPLPVDLFTKTDLEADFVRIFRTEIRKPWGTYYLCAIFNLNDSFRKVAISDSLLRIPKGRRYRLYDFWNEDYRGVLFDETTVEVPAQSAMVLRLEECRPHPWILSTDITVRQGDSEITALEWDADKLCLKGTAHRAIGEKGNIFFTAPDKFKVVNDNRGVLVFKSARDMSLVIKKHIDFDAADVDFRIDFEMWEGTSSNLQLER